jgi:arylsulfatase A-like enzyme
MVSRLDGYVGEIMDELKGKGLADNTLVIFTSDNGPHQEGGADPAFFGFNAELRGIKRQTHEGGVRVPFIAWWPGRVEAGVVNDHQLAFYDVMPTCCELAGVRNYAERYENPALEEDYFDGISFAPTLLDEPGQQQHEFLYWEFEETDQVAVRMGDWKMVSKSGKPHLYNLAEDLHEDNDVAAEHPDIVRQMVEIAHAQHVESPHFKVTMPRMEE